MKTNKEASATLQKYFLKQDPALIAEVCAWLIIDLNRVLYLNEFSEEEGRAFLDRLAVNMLEVSEIINGDDSRELRLKKNPRDSE